MHSERGWWLTWRLEVSWRSCRPWPMPRHRGGDGRWGCGAWWPVRRHQRRPGVRGTQRVPSPQVTATRATVNFSWRLRTKQGRPHIACRPVYQTPLQRTKEGRPRAASTSLDQQRSCWRQQPPLRHKPATYSRRRDFRSNPLATLLTNLLPTQEANSKVIMYRECASCLHGIHVSATQP
jgi:hypothetical protein